MHCKKGLLVGSIVLALMLALVLAGAGDSSTAVQPNTTYPVNYTRITGTSVMLNWSASDPAYELDTGLNYTLCLSSTIATVLNNASCTNVVNETNYTATGLLNGTTYYWKVRSYNASEFGNMSEFSSWNQTLYTANFSEPAVGDYFTDSENSFDSKWQKISAPPIGRDSTYDTLCELGENCPVVNASIEVQNGYYKLDIELYGPGEYLGAKVDEYPTWVAKATSASGWSVVHFFNFSVEDGRVTVYLNDSESTRTVKGRIYLTRLADSFRKNAPPNITTLLYPSNSQRVYSENVTLTWAPSYDAESDLVTYIVHFGTSSDPPVYNIASSYSLNITTSPGQTYYWYVVSNDSYENGSTSSLRTFARNNRPSTPQLLSPPNASLGRGTLHTLKWIDVFDSDIHLMVPGEANQTDWGISGNSVNITNQTAFVRDGSFGLNWTVSNDGDTISETNILNRTFLAPFDASAYDALRFYVQTTDKAVSGFKIVLYDKESDWRQWNYSLAAGAEYLLTVNLTNPTSSAGSFNLTNVSYIQLLVEEIHFGTGDTSVAQNTSLYFDYFKFVNLRNGTITYYVYYENGTSPSYHSSTEQTTLAVSSVPGITKYYWRVVANDSYEQSNSSETFFFNKSYYEASIGVYPNKTIYNLGNNIEFNVTTQPADIGFSNLSIPLLSTTIPLRNETYSSSFQLLRGNYTVNDTTQSLLSVIYNQTAGAEIAYGNITLYVTDLLSASITPTFVYYSNGTNLSLAVGIFDASGLRAPVANLSCINSQTLETINITANGTDVTCRFVLGQYGPANFTVYAYDQCNNSVNTSVLYYIDWLYMNITANASTYPENTAGYVNVSLFNSTAFVPDANITCNDTWRGGAGMAIYRTNTDAAGNATCHFNFTESGPHTIYVTGTKGNISVTDFINVYVNSTILADIWVSYLTSNPADLVLNRYEYYGVWVNLTKAGSPVTGIVNTSANMTANVTVEGEGEPFTVTETATAGLYNATRQASLTGTTGVKSVVFHWKNQTSNESAYANTTLSVSSSLILTAQSLTSLVNEDTASYFYYIVSDIHGADIDTSASGAVSCSPSQYMTSSEKGLGAGARVVLCTMTITYPGTYNVTVGYSRNGNYGNGTSSVIVSLVENATSGTGDDTGGGSSSSSVTLTAKPISFDSFEREVNLTLGVEKTLIYTVENEGDELAHLHMRMSGMDPDWYESESVEVPAKEKKDVYVRVLVPSTAENGTFYYSAQIKADVCGVKSENGTYLSVGTCKTARIKFHLLPYLGETPLTTSASEALSALNAASKARDSLVSWIFSLESLDLSTAEANASLEGGDALLSQANNLYGASDYPNAKSKADLAFSKFNTAISDSEAQVDELISPLLDDVENKVFALLGNVKGEDVTAVNEAKKLLQQAKVKEAEGDYAGMKLLLDQAYALIKDIPIPETLPPEPVEAGAAAPPFGVSLTLIATLVTFCLLAGFGYYKREVIIITVQEKNLLARLPPSLVRRIPASIQLMLRPPEKVCVAGTEAKVTLAKYTWPKQLVRNAQNQIAINLSIRNESDSPMNSVIVHDTLPLGFTLLPDSFAGVDPRLVPQVEKVMEGTRLAWSLQNIMPGQTLQLAYKVMIIPIEGQLHLSQARIKFTYESKEKEATTPVQVVPVVGG
ncbi:MAG: fibronectin type III domain-containing protein [archaeon]